MTAFRGAPNPQTYGRERLCAIPYSEFVCIRHSPKEIGSRGQEWLDNLPRLVAGLCSDWRLTPERDMWHGYCSLVMPVSRGGSHYVLKATPFIDQTGAEALGLGAWAGDGAVQIIDHRIDLGVLLLERLDAGHSLNDLPIESAVETACLDMNRARGWTIVRMVDYWLWALTAGLTEDPITCRSLIEWLVS